jgi:hypothetical protein
MQIKDPLRRPDVTMLFIIDHSGSMADASGGVAKLELAKEAAIRSLDLLFPTDRVGVIAFDDTAQWVAPVTDLDEPERLKNAIASLRPGGGTDILAGVQAAAEALPDDPGQVKHVILLTDGGADPTGIPELIRQMNEEHGITLSAVGVGRDAAPFLPELANVGQGRYHFTADPSTIPSIFTEETSLATRSYLIEETFFPELAAPSPILDGITEMPPLHGYVGTSPKATARTILVSHQDDPLLAAWQYGLGKAVVFTSDATGRWASEWLAWPGFTTFWSQAVRYALRQPSAGLLEAQVELDGETARLVVNAQTASGEYLNHYDLSARLVEPSGATRTLALEQVASGRYEAEFIPGEPGAYLIGLSGQPAERGEETVEGPAAGPLVETAGWVLSYSPEYRRLEGDPGALARLAALANGRLAPDSPAEAFSHDFQAARSRRPVWPWLLALAAILLPVDIAVRRLVVTPAELRRAAGRAGAAMRARFRALFLGEPLAEGPAPQRSRRMEALLDARKRAASQREGAAPRNTPVEREAGPAPEAGRPPQPAAPRGDSPAVGAEAKPGPSSSEPGAEEPATTAKRLLARKRKRPS